MPDTEQILAGLGGIATQYRWLAVLWHGYVALLLAGLLIGLRPSRRVAALLLLPPLGSVAVLAWLAGNPFNGLLFSLAVIGLGASVALIPRGPIGFGPWWAMGPGAALVVLGWVYPHFLPAPGFPDYLYAAPTGLIPCPSLLIVTGLAAMLGGLGSKAWTGLLGAFGLLYGLIGVAWLGVNLDFVLLAGALLPLVTVLAADRVNGFRSFTDA